MRHKSLDSKRKKERNGHEAEKPKASSVANAAAQRQWIGQQEMR